MLARISTVFNGTEEGLWNQIIEPKSLRYVALPILGFTPVEAGALDGEWEVGRDYPLNLYLLGFIPLGRHTIRLTKIDQRNHTIVSQERGFLVPVWNHTIVFYQVTPDRVHYTDEIAIEAGWRTPFIWLFAHLFYRHRQRRWRSLLQTRR
jgi:hypothetical protein